MKKTRLLIYILCIALFAFLVNRKMQKCSIVSVEYTRDLMEKMSENNSLEVHNGVVEFHFSILGDYRLKCAELVEGENVYIYFTKKPKFSNMQTKSVNFYKAKYKVPSKLLNGNYKFYYKPELNKKL